MRKITVAIPTFQRTDLLFQSFNQILNDDRVGEIVIVDDASDESVWNEINFYCIQYPKIKLFRNTFNLDCYRNKHKCVQLASSEWVVLFDSDNILTTDYLDKIFEHGWTDDVIYAPVFAFPNFDYREFAGNLIHKGNVASCMPKNLFSTALNTCNFFVNRSHYLDVWDGSCDPVTSDSIYFNYCWLEAGNKIYFVSGLEYFHLVHSQSHYQNNNKRTAIGFHEEIENKLKQLR